jgi:hypothetical protein
MRILLDWVASIVLFLRTASALTRRAGIPHGDGVVLRLT